MKITANRNHLLAALGSVSVAMANKVASPLSAYVLLKSEGDKLTVTADSTQLRAESTIDCRTALHGSVLVSHQKLTAMLQRDVEEVTLEVVDGRLAISFNGSVAANLSLMAVDGFPAARDDKNSKAFVILDGKSFGYALQVACPCAGDGVAHDWNHGLNISDDGKDLTLRTGNGHQFCRIKLPTSDNKFEITLPAKFVRSLAAIFSASESLTMTVFDKGAAFVADNFSVWVQASAAGYNSKGVDSVASDYDQHCNQSATINREQLLQAAQVASGILDEGIALEFSLTTNPQAINITASSKHNEDCQESIACNVKTALEPRGVNHKYFIGHLRSLASDEVALHYSPDRAVTAMRVTSTVDGSWSWYLAFVLKH